MTVTTSKALRLAMLCMAMAGCYPQSSVGYFVSGGDLSKHCLPDKQNDFCVGYIAGTFDLFSLLASKHDALPNKFCISSRYGLSELIAKTSRVLIRDSHSRAIAANDIVEGFSKEFPCSALQGPSARYYFDRGGLHKYCLAEGRETFCLGYTLGAYDTLDWSVQFVPGVDGLICLPASIEAGQLNSSLIRVLRASKTPADEHGAVTVLVSLVASYSCEHQTTDSRLVEHVQKLLQRAGYSPGPIDGMIGERTISAIRRFQRDVGVDQNGEVSQELANLLEAHLAANPTGQDYSSGALNGNDIIGTGSGFFVNPQGGLITNLHVVNECQGVSVHFRGQRYAARVTDRDSSFDLALLAVDIKSPGFASIETTHEVDLGDFVIAAGFPLRPILSSDLSITIGNISALSGIQSDPRLYQFTAPVQPGNSGGPLLDEYGHVIGVVVAHLDEFLALGISGSIPQNVNFAIKGTYLRMFLDSKKLWYTKAKIRKKLEPSRIAKAAEEFVASVECWGK